MIQCSAGKPLRVGVPSTDVVIDGHRPRTCDAKVCHVGHIRLERFIGSDPCPFSRFDQALPCDVSATNTRYDVGVRSKAGAEKAKNPDGGAFEAWTHKRVLTPHRRTHTRHHVSTRANWRLH